MRFLAQRLTALALIAAAIPTLFASSAAAQVAPEPGTYATNGVVDALARGNGATYLGGNFTRVGPRVGHGIEVSTADATPGDLPDVAGGRVLAVVGDGAGGWYVGGDFTSVGGQPHAGVAHIDAAGELDPGFVAEVRRSDGTVGEVRALALDADGGVL